MRLQRAVWIVCLATPAATATAEVRLPHVLSDHAVLQREQPVRIWGWAAPAEQVHVMFHEQTVAAQADQWGAWQAWLKPEKAGGPYTLKVTGDATTAPLVRTDILMGDVWIAAGQSNMEFPLQGFGADTQLKNQDQEIAASTQPNLRLLLQARVNSPMPLVDSSDTWTLCTPDTAKKFSAVAYFFGRRIAEEENVPVGLISITWGGTAGQAWISPDGVAWGGLNNLPAETAFSMNDMARATAIKTQNEVEDAKAKAEGKQVVKHPRAPGDHGPFTPSVLFNGMVAPYVNYAIKGTLWYQGETDGGSSRTLYYSRVFPALIEDWRRQWDQGNFPFLFVQLTSFDGGDDWGIIRDAQRRALKLVNTGMAVSLDVGKPTNAHPPDKQTVGARLAQTALGMVYGRNVETASPTFERATTEGNGIRAWFSHAEGLKPVDAVISDFEVAGADHKFVPATVSLEKVGELETVVATASGMNAPMFVRYGWAKTVKSYLYNASGLPMGTFTSESDEWLLLRH